MLHLTYARFTIARSAGKAEVLNPSIVENKHFAFLDAPVRSAPRWVRGSGPVSFRGKPRSR